MARAPAALPQGISESISAEESSLLDADRVAEREAPAEQAAPAPEAAPAPVSAEPAAEGAPVAEAAPVLSVEQQQANAVTQERERRKAAEKREAESKATLATMQGRLDVLAELAQRQTQPAPTQDQSITIPDVNEDPIGHFTARAQLAEQTTARIAEQFQQMQSQAQVQNNVQGLMRIAQAQEETFKAEKPDYPQAADFLKASRDRELQFMGIADPYQRQQLILQDVAAIAAQALQLNRNFGEIAYQLAEARGYQSAAPAPAPLAAKVPAPAQTTPSAADRIQAVAAGQAANVSLSQVPGSAAPRALSVTELANMPEEKFAAVLAKAEKEGKSFQTVLEELTD